MPDSGQIDILTPTLSLPERRRAGLKLEFGSLNVMAKKCKLENLSSFDLNSNVGLSDVSPPSPFPARTITSHELATRLSNSRSSKNTLIVDCRPFSDFSKAHIRGSINVNCIDRQNRKKLQQKGKVALVDLVTTKEGKDIFRKRASKEIVVYDDTTDDTNLKTDNALTSVLSLLFWEGREALVLKGGLKEFKSKHENLCEFIFRIESRPAHSPLTPLVEQQIEGAQMSQILPFLYLGNERDASNLQTLKDLNITYILNVTSHLRPHFENDGIHYKTIPVADSGHQNLRKYFDDAIEYIDEARKNGANILIHCQAGVSRSATVTIAYLLKHSTLTMTDAYRYVKQKRAIISPNFNFMGQLMEFEQALNNGKPNRVNDQSEIEEIL